MSKERASGSVDGGRGWKAWLYLLPVLAVFLVFVLYPMIKVLRMGFYQKYVYLKDAGTGFGLDSFRYVLNDPTFLQALKNTCFIVFIGVPITVALALGAAVLINSITRAKGFFRNLYFLPYVTSIIAVGIAFRWMFHSQYGYINYFLGLFGVSPQKWMTDPELVTISVTLFTIWNGLAYKIILFLAGLQKIDRQYYQAARIDGTSRKRTFFRITLPLLSPTLWMVVMISIIHAFKTYTEVFAMFEGSNAGPGNTAITLVYYIYNMFYVKGQVHYASAAALIFLAILLLLTALQKLVSRKFIHYN